MKPNINDGKSGREKLINLAELERVLCVFGAQISWGLLFLLCFSVFLGIDTVVQNIKCTTDSVAIPFMWLWHCSTSTN